MYTPLTLLGACVCVRTRVRVCQGWGLSSQPSSAPGFTPHLQGAWAAPEQSSVNGAFMGPSSGGRLGICELRLGGGQWESGPR